jgi:type I restriction enzyme S subunit
MSETLISKLSIDKTTWNKVKLGDVVTEPRDTVKDFTQEQIDHVVGLEHIDSEDIHLRRSANLDDSSTTFTKKFSAGDVLFGRRRAYLKKAAQASFSGICSGDITVMRAKNGLLPQLLPFVINNEKFFDYAITHSAGGLSPRVKFKDLANYEFLLPPKHQQAKLAELLWAMDEVVEKDLEIVEKLNRTYTYYIDEQFSQLKSNYQHVPLKKIASINRYSLKSNTDSDYEFQYLDIASITAPKVTGEMQKLKFSEAPSRARRIVSDNSIVLSLVRPYHKSFVLIKRANNLIASTGTAVIDVNEKYNPDFIFHQFFSKRFLAFCENRMTGTNYPAITSSDVEQFCIAIPDNNLIQNIQATKFGALDYSIEKVKYKILVSKNLQKSLINQIF